MRLLACLLVGLSVPALAQNVLAHHPPLRADGVRFPERMTDAESPLDGERWDGPHSAVLEGNQSVEWDLGEPKQLTAAIIQADNNDDYVLEVSDDGVTWRPGFYFRPAQGPGLQTRDLLEQPVSARYVKLTGRGGDGRFSVSELEVFAGDTGDSTILRAKWVPRRPLEQSFLFWVLGVAALVTLASTRLPAGMRVMLALGGLAWSAWLVFSLTPSTPDARDSLIWVRAAVALAAMVVVLRERLWRARWPVDGRVTVGALAVTAAMGLWAFLNLGAPQFHDVGQGRGTWLHHYDMRTYYPIAKYFPELRFDGVYAASVLAVAEGRNLDDFNGQPIRDLRTHVLTTVGQSRAHLEEIRGRFSPERWQLFLSDMQYFRRAMGDGGFLGSMNDHGGNATPVWFLSARALFANAPASDATLWSGVIADLLLLALAILAIGWAWGARTALLALTVFGAMDFYQFGSNWFGATLRHDWLSLWAIGIALLHKRKYGLAGAALAWSAWIRAFPALTFFTLSLPVLFLGGKALLRGQRDEALRIAKPWLRVIAGVAIASLVLVGLSVWVFGAASWVEWLHKVQTLDKDNHLNNISFRTYIDSAQHHSRYASVVAVALLAFFLRRSSLERAAAWGVALLPLVFNPANYYLHSAFLLVTLAAEHPTALGPRVTWRGTLVWLTVLGMCVASYFTNLPSDIGVHFRYDTVVAFVTLGLLLLLEVKRQPELTPAQA